MTHFGQMYHLSGCQCKCRFCLNSYHFQLNGTFFYPELKGDIHSQRGSILRRSLRITANRREKKKKNKQSSTKARLRNTRPSVCPGQGEVALARALVSPRASKSQRAYLEQGAVSPRLSYSQKYQPLCCWKGFTESGKQTQFYFI